MELHEQDLVGTKNKNHNELIVYKDKSSSTVISVPYYMGVPNWMIKFCTVSPNICGTWV